MNKQWVYLHPDWLVTKTYPKSKMKHHLIWSYFFSLKTARVSFDGKVRSLTFLHQQKILGPQNPQSFPPTYSQTEYKNILVMNQQPP